VASGLNAPAVFGRELRAESRRAVNYWLRVLAAGAVILVFASFVLSTPLSGPRLGGVLFVLLHRTLFYAFWIVAPLMTADCVSREQREGTLGLLFLTPLTTFDVIAGKAALHVLRALTLFLAALPVLGLPLVLGGADWLSFLLAIAYEGCAVLLGIAAGIYSSTKGGTPTQAMVRAEIYALALAAVSALWSFASSWILLASRRVPWFVSVLVGLIGNGVLDSDQLGRPPVPRLAAAADSAAGGRSRVQRRREPPAGTPGGVARITPRHAALRGQVIRGRLWGISCHYSPAFAVLLVGCVGDRLLNPRFYGAGLLHWMLPNPVVFCSLMVVGLYLSLGRLNFLLGWVLTWVIAFVGPLLITLALVQGAGWAPAAAVALPSALQVILMALVLLLLHRSLKQRTFLTPEAN
jgi:hypothetical protein